MKRILFYLFGILILAPIQAQEMEWNVDNTGTNPGERIVAVIDAGTLGNYDGVAITGTVIDNNGNWGYQYPTVSNFTAYVRFSSGQSFGIIQDRKTSRITLRFRRISNTKFHLTANLPDAHRGARVIFRKVEGSPSVVMGSPTTNIVQGELVLSEPTYKTIYVEDFGRGNVGIGTTNAASKLSVSNGSSSGSHHSFSDLTVEDDDNTMVNLLSPSNKVGYYGFSDSDDTYVGGMHYEHIFDSMIFRVNNHAHDMVILNNGNVGIGTLAPDSELAVNGNIHAKEVKVDLVGWPDYVFEENHKLPTLEEVEKHIKEKGHLINIPSAKEVEENGVQLGEMNKLLLEKIEELTLYTLEQQKELNMLKNELRELKKDKK